MIATITASGNNNRMRSSKMDEAKEIVTMRTPFPDRLINKKPQGTKAQNDCPANEKQNCKVCGGWHHPRVVHLDYVGHAALTDRLLDVDPAWNWEPVAFRDGLPAFDATGGLWIRLTVNGVTRLGYGNAPSTTFKEIGSREKEVIGDALRNAAMRFGAALDLWFKGDLHGDEQEKEQAKPANFDAEIKSLRDCGSLDALVAAWGKLDAPTKHALSAIKDECKGKIESADGGAT